MLAVETRLPETCIAKILMMAEPGFRMGIDCLLASHNTKFEVVKHRGWHMRNGAIVSLSHPATFGVIEVKGTDRNN